LTDTVTKYLDGTALADALASGIHKVIGAQEFLNRINVFPVADGDTGTNLSLSLGAVLAATKQAGDKHLGTLLAAIADTLLDSARGNSGAIQVLGDGVSQVTAYSRGIRNVVPWYSRMTPSRVISTTVGPSSSCDCSRSFAILMKTNRSSGMSL
jgi:hypothetical protein